MREFNIIERYFSNLTANIDSDNNSNIILDKGDDAAVLDVKSLQNIAVSTDTLVAGTHFLIDCPAKSVGHKALAVNLSDMAAMAAIPKWFTLSLTLPEFNQQWLAGFSDGVAKLAQQHQIKLVGGDLSKGPLSVTITIIGEALDNTNKQYLTRSGAQHGDALFVTGDLGLPPFILDIILKNKNSLQSNSNYLIEEHDIVSLAKDLSVTRTHNKLYYPEPRLQAAQFIKQYATAAIDLSDGLIQDLGHILKQSKLNADIILDNLPVADGIFTLLGLQKATDSLSKMQKQQLLKYLLTGGDEYEILFTAPMDYMQELLNYKDMKISYIGEVFAQTNDRIKAVEFIDSITDGVSHKVTLDFLNDNGWQHFK